MHPYLLNIWRIDALLQIPLEETWQVQQSVNSNIFDLQIDAFKNCRPEFVGTVLPTMVFCGSYGSSRRDCNRQLLLPESALRPLTRCVVGYGAIKLLYPTWQNIYGCWVISNSVKVCISKRDCSSFPQQNETNIDMTNPDGSYTTAKSIYRSYSVQTDLSAPENCLRTIQYLISDTLNSLRAQLLS